MKDQNPAQFVPLLLEKLAGTTRHVSFLIGAGGSKAVGLPDVPTLAKEVGGIIAAKDQELAKHYATSTANRNIEEALSWVRAIATMLQGTDSNIQGVTADIAGKLDKAICSAIAEVVQRPLPETSTPHRALGSWAGRAEHTLPVEIFTLNYDLLIEHGLEVAGVPYFDGFVGTFEGRFRTDLVDGRAVDAQTRLDLPPGWVRLWKLHGSVSWRIRIPSGAESPYICRVGNASTSTGNEILAIYPSAEKYQESRRLPFVALFDRFRRSLASPESVTITCGYSFQDQHVNEIIFDSVERYPRSEIVALFFSEIPAAVQERAKRFTNFTAAGAKITILSGEERTWKPIDGNVSDLIWKEDKFVLGNFNNFASVLMGGSARFEKNEP